jgi:hypothetical protein
MDFSTVRTGELIAGISGVALFIIMFLTWFELPDIGGGQLQGIAEAIGADTSYSAWQAFDFTDIVLLLAAVAGVGLAVLASAQSNVQLPVAASAIAAGLGILATLLVLYRIIDPPNEWDRAYGVFLGLIASAGIAAGGWMAMQEEGSSFGGEDDRFGGGRET